MCESVRLTDAVLYFEALLEWPTPEKFRLKGGVECGVDV